MQQLALHHQDLLKGTFELKKLNFLFAFQVNCPGCFFYGIPLVNKLYSTYADQVAFLGLSTAFEDYEYNNTKNTQLLLDKNETIGHTKQALKNEGYDSNPSPVLFPVAMDQQADASFDYEKAAETICNINPEYSIWPEFEQIALKKKVLLYLKKLDKISLTFTLNQMRGTPTMMIFNDQYEILYHKFGHTKYEEIEQKLTSIIHQFNS